MFKKKWRKKAICTNFLLGVTLLVGLAGVRVVYSAEASQSPSQKRSFLRFAPVRFSNHSGGMLTYALQRYVLGGQSLSQSLSLSIYSNIRAHTYIGHPLIAPIEGGLGVEYSGLISDASNNSAVKSAVVGLNGDAVLHLRPRSRYATRVSISQKKYKAVVGQVNSNGGLRKFEIVQRYTSPFSVTTWGSVSFARNEFDAGTGVVGSLQDDKVQEDFMLDLNHALSSLQRVHLDWQLKRRYFPLLSTKTLDGILRLKHFYRPTGTKWSSTYDNYKFSERKGGGATRFTSQQFNSFGSVSVSQRFTISGGGRWQQLSGNNQLGRTSSTIRLSAGYRISSRVSASAVLGVNDEPGKVQETYAGVGVSASDLFGKNAQRVTKFGIFSYKKYVKASVNAGSTASVLANNAQSQSIGGSSKVSSRLDVGHSIAGATNFYGGKLLSSINQSTGYVAILSDSSSQFAPLNTYGSLGWLHKENISKDTTSVRVTASDVRNFGNSTLGSSRLYNLQATHNRRIGKVLSFGSSLTAQSAFYNGVASRAAYANASLGYTNKRAFQIRRLVFTSNLLALYNLRPATSDSQGQLNWDNRFTYDIGLTTMLLDINFARQAKNSIGYLRFQLRREF